MNQIGMEAGQAELNRGSDSVERLVGHFLLFLKYGMHAAPKDGTEIMLLIRHRNYELADEAQKPDWQEWCVGKWIDHNGGGWTWHGIAGSPVAWLPLPNSNSAT